MDIKPPDTGQPMGQPTGAVPATGKQDTPPAATTPPIPPKTPVIAASPEKEKGEEVVSGGGLRVSLMPSDLEGEKRPDLTRRSLILALVIVLETLLVGGVYLYLTKSAASRAGEGDKLEAERVALETSISEQEKTMVEAVDFNRQVSAIQETLEHHYYWTSMLHWLEQNTRPNVIYYNFNADADSGFVAVDAKGQGYRDLAEQIILFRENPYVIDFKHSATSLALGRDDRIEGALMSFSLRLKPEVWKRAIVAEEAEEGNEANTEPAGEAAVNLFAPVVTVSVADTVDGSVTPNPPVINR